MALFRCSVGVFGVVLCVVISVVQPEGVDPGLLGAHDVGGRDVAGDDTCYQGEAAACDDGPVWHGLPVEEVERVAADEWGLLDGGDAVEQVRGRLAALTHPVVVRGLPWPGAHGAGADASEAWAPSRLREALTAPTAPSAPAFQRSRHTHGVMVNTALRTYYGAGHELWPEGVATDATHATTEAHGLVPPWHPDHDLVAPHPRSFSDFFDHMACFETTPAATTGDGNGSGLGQNANCRAVLLTTSDLGPVLSPQLDQHHPALRLESCADCIIGNGAVCFTF
eukprot:m.27224 g.27224  ORF g.27224 m.27224 type:complete len:281 (+) comp8498_c0_seq1:68-910(+)